uniref:Uncharacterized protein n=1 Tax=Lepeophtheirus salmonis TaxID=72036 RepID=A0A0K2UIB5_LEPSM
MIEKQCKVNSKRNIYEDALKSFRPNKDTIHFFRILIFRHSLLVSLHTSPSDAPVSITWRNSTRPFSMSRII